MTPPAQPDRDPDLARLQALCQRFQRERQALAELQEILFGLVAPGDLEQVIEAVGAALRTAGVPFENYTLALVDRAQDPPIMRVHGRSPTDRREYTGVATNLELWQRGTPLYRPDLEADDPLGEYEALQTWRPIRCVLDVPFSHGTLGLSSARPNALSTEDLSFVESLGTTLSVGYRRWDEVRLLQRQRLVAQVSARLERAVWDMGRTEEVSGLLEAVRQGLTDLAVPYDHLVVNLFHPEHPAYPTMPHLSRPLPDGIYESVRPGNMLDAVWRSGQPDYRPDLEAVDPHHEAAGIAQRYGAPIRAVLDVPFAMGTLSINSRREYAFHEDDVSAVQTMAEGLSQGFRRLRDLTALEARTRDLERETRLRQAETTIRLQVAEMTDPGNLAAVLAAIEQELANAGVAVRSVSVQFIHPSGQGFVSANATDTASTVARVLAEAQHDPPLPALLQNGRGFPWVLEVWRTGTTCYQRRLPLDTPWLPGGSVVDVPLPQGTLAMNSSAPEAFSPAEITLFERLAGPLAQGLQRSLDLLRREQAEAQLRQAQRLEAIGRLAGGVAHDINNVLTVINGYAEFLLHRRLRPDDPNRTELEEILHAGRQGASVVQQLLAFSRQQVLRPTLVDLNRVIASTRTMLARLVGEHVSVVLRLAPNLGAVRVDPAQFSQILVNLVTNGRDAMPGGGQITIATANVDLTEAFCLAHPGASPGPHVRLTVTDHGTGMDAATQERVFEPFFTTKELGRGTGLGLAMVQGTVRQSGGSIWVDSQPGLGTTVVVCLPRLSVLPSDQPEPVPLSVADPTPGRGETILVAEDDAQIRRLLESLLTQAGYAVLLAADGEEALRLATGHAGPIHLLLTDLVMPRMSGQELAVRLRSGRPAVRVLFMSGYTADFTPLPEDVAAARFLAKPLDTDAVLAAVRDALDTVSPANGPHHA